MEIILNPPKSLWKKLCTRNIPDDSKIEATVREIIANVKENGDEALKEYALKFDGLDSLSIPVSDLEIEEAYDKVDDNLKSAIHKAAENICRFHLAQRPSEIKVETTPGVVCYQKPVAIKKVGLYIPGGQAPLFSTVLMLACPAMIAGCQEVILCTPRGRDGKISPEILYAAHFCNVHKIYGIGGAQAIAAMAYGTETVSPVNKIFGPGNRYVTKAKMLVTDRVAIDMPAGPSEVLVFADETAQPDFVAADLLSQAEHGPDSQAILVCDKKEIADKVVESVERLGSKLSRTDSIRKSLSQSRALVFDDTDTAIEFIDEYAPEHLIISTSQPWEKAGKISCAGSVFIGNYSPESAGDYASGTNHTLPTSGWATSFSGVNLDSFLHKITYQELTREGLASLAPVITSMAKAEGLDAHALAVDIRTLERREPK